MSNLNLLYCIGDSLSSFYYGEDYAARVEWGWAPEYNLGLMTEDMLKVLKYDFF